MGRGPLHTVWPSGKTAFGCQGFRPWRTRTHWEQAGCDVTVVKSVPAAYQTGPWLSAAANDAIASAEAGPTGQVKPRYTVWGTRSLYLQGHMISWPASDNEELKDRSYSVSQSVARFTTETLWAGLVPWTGHPTYVFGLWEETGRTWSSNRCTAKPPQPNYAF